MNGMDNSGVTSDAEVERLRKLVMDLEKQNTALRSQKPGANDHPSESRTCS